MSAWTRLPRDFWKREPYPGERPDCSWRLTGDHVHRVVPAGQDGWIDTVTEEEIDLGGRVFILAYGSNANPAKLRGIADPVMLQAEITDAQAVWSSGRRRRDNSVVATIARRTGHVEACPVLAVHPETVWQIDEWEGEGSTYIREGFWGRCTLENGRDVSAEVYVGGHSRQPLVVDGNHVPLHDADHSSINGIVP